MLAQLGRLQFTVVPFGMEDHEHETGASFASHEVLGRRPALEFVGEMSEQWLIRGTLFTKELGGLSELDALHAMRRSGVPQFFMRGDGVPMGWVVVEHVREKSSYFAMDGVGRMIKFELAIKRADPPNAAGIFNALSALFT